MKLTAEQEISVLNHYLAKENLKLSDELEILDNAWGCNMGNHCSYIRPVVEKVIDVSGEYKALLTLLNSVEVKPNTVSVQVEEYHEQEEERWVHDSGLNLVITSAIRTKTQPLSVATSKLNWFKRDYEWKTEYQPTGKDVKRYNNLLNQLKTGL